MGNNVYPARAGELLRGAARQKDQISISRARHDCSGALIRCPRDHGFGAIEPFAANGAALAQSYVSAIRAVATWGR